MILTTDEMDSITPKERRELVGYCEHCDKFVHFVGDSDSHCPTCDGKYSHAIGLQVTTQRTFDLVRSKKDLAKWKKKVKK